MGTPKRPTRAVHRLTPRYAPVASAQSVLASTKSSIMRLRGLCIARRQNNEIASTSPVFPIMVGTLGTYANVNSPIDEETLGPAVITSTGPAEFSLAQHLEKTGATFYSAWWCPHCHDQKQRFGSEASKLIPYVECSTPDGKNQTLACQEASITGYPTWEINGKRLPGSQTLEDLAQPTNYQGPSDFNNTP